MSSNPSQTKAETKSPPKKSKKELQKVQRRAYFDIVAGFTQTTLEGETAYIRHFDLHTQTIVDKVYDEAFEKAKAKGLMTEEDLLSYLEEEGVWSKEEEKSLKEARQRLEGAHANIAKAASAHMKKSFENSIATIQEEVREKEKKKQSLIENTCEQYAERRSSDQIVRVAFYKKDKKTLFYTDKDFELLEKEEIEGLIHIYNEASSHLSTENIKSISVADFFASFYSVVEERPSDFFRRPIHELTFFQINLLSYARVMGSIMKNLDPPDHIRDDPERLLAFAKSENKKREAEARKGKKRAR
jgi:hypothetical protein